MVLIGCHGVDRMMVVVVIGCMVLIRWPWWWLIGCHGVDRMMVVVVIGCHGVDRMMVVVIGCHGIDG